jgi:hypothetical protein
MRLLVACIAFSVGCGFKSEPCHNDQGVSTDDAAAPPDGPQPPVIDFAGLDLTGVDLAQPPGSCAPPLLLVALRSTAGTGLSGGHVMRVPLPGGVPDPVNCPDLTDRGFLPDPETVGWFTFNSRAYVAVGSHRVLNLIDVATDQGLWMQMPTEPSPDAVDIFPLVDANETLIGVGWDVNSSTGEIDVLYGFHFDNTVAPFHVKLDNVMWPSGTVEGMTQDPMNPGRLLQLDDLSSQVSAASEIDPFAAPPKKFTPAYVNYPPSTYLTSISSLRANGVNRSAWVLSRQTSPPTDGVFYLNDTTGRANQSPQGPVTCPGHTCKYIHAVPDPTVATGLIAICEPQLGGARQVLRWRSDDTQTCDVVVDDSTLNSLGIMRLAIAQ